MLFGATKIARIVYCTEMSVIGTWVGFAHGVCVHASNSPHPHTSSLATQFRTVSSCPWRYIHGNFSLHLFWASPTHTRAYSPGTSFWTRNELSLVSGSPGFEKVATIRWSWRICKPSWWTKHPAVWDVSNAGVCRACWSVVSHWLVKPTSFAVFGLQIFYWKVFPISEIPCEN